MHWLSMHRAIRPIVWGLVLLCGCTLAAIGQTFTTGGTGFVVSSDGYILTNYHVVEGAGDTILVTLHDGTELEAVLIDYSPTIEGGGADVALLKVNADGLSFLNLADSEDVQLFEQVIVMGFPLSFVLGVDLNITGGNITAFRTLADTQDVFQIDAIVNPGNSGGPVINEFGQVVGIATAGIRELNGTPIEGVSFAVPANAAYDLARTYVAGLRNPLGSGAAPLEPRDIVSNATPAVVYITWEDVYLEEGQYSEDFSRKREWYEEYWNPKGFIEIRQDNEGYLISLECPCTASGPVFEVDLLFTRYGDGLAGIVIHPEDRTRWSYAVLIDAEGKYAFYKRSPDGSTWKVAQGWKDSRHLRQGIGVVNSIRIEVSPTYAVISFNGESATTLNAEISLGGGIALAVGTWDGPTSVRFDNLRICRSQGSDMQ